MKANDVVYYTLEEYNKNKSEAVLKNNIAQIILVILLLLSLLGIFFSINKPWFQSKKAKRMKIRKKRLKEKERLRKQLKRQNEPNEEESP